VTSVTREYLFTKINMWRHHHHSRIFYRSTIKYVMILRESSTMFAWSRHRIIEESSHHVISIITHHVSRREARQVCKESQHDAWWHWCHDSKNLLDEMTWTSHRNFSDPTHDARLSANNRDASSDGIQLRRISYSVRKYLLSPLLCSIRNHITHRGMPRVTRTREEILLLVLNNKIS